MRLCFGQHQGEKWLQCRSITAIFQRRYWAKQKAEKSQTIFRLVYAADIGKCKWYQAEKLSLKSWDIFTKNDNTYQESLFLQKHLKI